MLRIASYLSSRSCQATVRGSAAFVAMSLLFGCASARQPLPATHASVSSLPTDGAIAFGSIDELGAKPVVQVRDFWGLRNVSVLGFYDENATYGLRAEIRPDGDLTTLRRRGDHLLYINSFVVSANGGFRRASVGTRDNPLVAGYLFDPNACLKGPPCSPYRSVTLGIPDSVLRNSPDGMVVLFERHTPTQWTIVLSAKMVATYLSAVDSVSAARRDTRSMRGIDR
jgi:hypothetical protein